jgi:hypothetical protein
MAGFDNLSNAFSTGIQAGNAAGPGRFSGVNDGLQTILQLLVQKKQQDDYYAKQMQMQQAGFGQESALQKERLGQQASEFGQSQAQQASQFGQTQQAAKEALAQRIAAMQQIADTRAKAAQQVAQTRTTGTQKAAQQKMDLSAPSRFKSATGKNVLQATLEQQYPFRSHLPFAASFLPQPTQGQMRNTMAGAGVLQKAIPEPSAVPSPGSVEDGYTFMGGDPSDPNSWEAVK